MDENLVWDEYWKKKGRSSRVIYDVIASFYRKFIIKRSLNHFIKKHFEPGARVLHAGCGSGQVDTDIIDYLSIQALDFSFNGLLFYRQVNGRKAHLLQGDIFRLPVRSGAFAGIYNLGVMEHFTEEEIRVILQESRRVLKEGGRMVMFWPPEFGLSVMFFKVLVFIFKKLLFRKNVKFHPDEITRLRSKKHAGQMLSAAGFTIVDYYFGIRDLFTYAVVVAENTR